VTLAHRTRHASIRQTQRYLIRISQELLAWRDPRLTGRPDRAVLDLKP
jgi:hypothetical protein